MLWPMICTYLYIWYRNLIEGTAHHLFTCSLSITPSKIMTRGEKVWSKTRFQGYLLWPSPLTLKLGSRSLYTSYPNALWKYEKIQTLLLLSISMIQRRNSNSSLYAKLPWLKDCTKLLGSLRSTWKSEVSLCASLWSSCSQWSIMK